MMNKENKNINKFKDWDVYEVLPKGWEIDLSCGSPLFGYDFCTNMKSILNGGKRALVKSIRKGVENAKFIDKKDEKITEEIKKDEPKKIFIFPSKTVNNLARKKFEEQLLKEIKFDLIVCELEGWDKKEYIKELKTLINGINISDNSNKKEIQQPTLF
jgi:glutaredoxin